MYSICFLFVTLIAIVVSLQPIIIDLKLFNEAGLTDHDISENIRKSLTYYNKIEKLSMNVTNIILGVLRGETYFSDKVHIFPLLYRYTSNHTFCGFTLMVNDKSAIFGINMLKLEGKLFQIQQREIKLFDPLLVVLQGDFKLI